MSVASNEHDRQVILRLQSASEILNRLMSWQLDILEQGKRAYQAGRRLSSRRLIEGSALDAETPAKSQTASRTAPPSSSTANAA